jgi:hypothetical protein
LEKCHYLPAVQADWRLQITEAIGYNFADQDHQGPFNDAKREARGE